MFVKYMNIFDMLYLIVGNCSVVYVAFDGYLDIGNFVLKWFEY